MKAGGLPTVHVSMLAILSRHLARRGCDVASRRAETAWLEARTAEPDPEMGPMVAGRTFAAALTVFAAGTDDGFRPRRVEWDFQAEGAAAAEAAYARFFGAPCAFGARRLRPVIRRPAARRGRDGACGRREK